MTGRFLRATWFHFYDELGRNLLGNLFWVVACVFPIPLLGLPIATCALCHYAGELTQFRDPPIRVFWQGYRIHFWRGLFYGWGFLLLALPVVFSLIFYLLRAAEHGFWALLLVGVSTWITVLYGLTSFYFFPFLVHQRNGFWTTLKRAGLAVMLRPGLAVVGTLVSLIWMTASLLITPLLFLVPAVWWCVSGMTALLLLREEYDDRVPVTHPPDPPEPDPQAGQSTDRSDFQT